MLWRTLADFGGLIIPFGGLWRTGGLGGLWRTLADFGGLGLADWRTLADCLADWRTFGGLHGGLALICCEIELFPLMDWWIFGLQTGRLAAKAGKGGNLQGQANAGPKSG